MEDKNRKIVIGEQKSPYQIPLNLLQMSVYLEYIKLNSNRELKSIFEMLSLDSASRIKYDNTIEFKTSEKERKSLRNINKALTMELFSSGIFGHIDSSAEVHANCLVNHLQQSGDISTITVPTNFAQGGEPDVEIDYGDFIVILEVSSKYQPSLEHFKSQLSGALKHARSIREDGSRKPIYCILINERSLSLVENMLTLKKFLKCIKPIEKIYITAISIDEFANLGQKIATQYEEDISTMSSDDLHGVLKNIVNKGIHGRFHQQLLEYLDVETHSELDF